LKNLSPKRKHTRSSSKWWTFIITVCLACNHRPGQQQQDVPAKIPQPVKTVTIDSFVAPVRIPLAAANYPKAVPSGTPVFRRDPSNGGLPFFASYGTEQGLSISTVSCSAVDHLGNLWFGTAGGGISRYDGKSFTNYNTAQGLAGNVIICILVTRDGNLWIGTTSGVSKYDGKRFTNFTMAQGLPDNFVGCAIQDRMGDLWFGTYGGGLSKFDGRHFTNYSTAQGLAENFLRCVMEDRDGSFWIGTNSKGVSHFDGNKFTNYSTANGTTNNAVNSILQDRNGNLWFSTGGGLIKNDGDRFYKYTAAEGLPDNEVHCILQDTAGNLWIGTSGGMSLYNGTRFTNYTKAQGLPDNDISSILQDKSGNIWCTSQGGVTEYKGSTCLSYSTSEGFTASTIFTIINDTSGNIWFGTKTRGACKFNGSGFENFTKTQGLTDNWIWEIFQDKAGNFWFGTNLGVCRYDGKNFRNFTTADGLPDNSVWSIMQDSRQNIWFGTKNGASRFDGKSFTNYTKTQGLPDNNIQSILEDKTGTMWFGTHDGGASRYDGKRFTTYSKTDGLPSNTIYRLANDKYGNVWFGCNAGASKFDGHTFTNYGIAQGLTGGAIWGMIEDTAKNMFWFGTSTGLSGLKEKTPTASKKETAAFENFNEKTGYPINDVHSLCLDAKGILWVGCGNGKAIKFNYAAVPKSTAPLNLVIQNIKVHNENVCWNDLMNAVQSHRATDSLTILNEMVTKFGKVLSPDVMSRMHDEYGDIQFDSLTPFYTVPVNLTLPYKNNNLTIEFAAIKPDMPGQVKYQYKLDGYDKTWSPLTNNSTAVFGNITEGNYTFELAALSPFGIRSETKYSFKVLPPWQRTWWAYTLFILLFVSVVWLLIARRSRVLVRKNRILEEKVEERTVQLKQSLENLKATQSQLIQREKMASLGELTAGVAHEIQNPLNFVNNFSDLNKELIEDMQKELQAGNNQEAIIISNNVKENEEKINHHGRRADSIVRNMLQHSRNTTGRKELSNINKLTDEYLQLSYHGMRAREKSLNVKMQTDFDPAAGEIEMVTQDIGRVLLNLFNNAFYAVSEKVKKQIQGYEPTISVSTKKLGNLVEIRIADNGTGIPARLIDKIFQPFFTTKPTGEGTGLGLSLSYDIIKAHGGELNVQTKEGDGAEFIVQIPVV